MIPNEGMIKTLNLAARGLLFEICRLLENSKMPILLGDDKEIACRLNVKFPHFSKSLKVLVHKRMIVRTEEGLKCPVAGNEQIRRDIRKTFVDFNSRQM